MPDNTLILEALDIQDAANWRWRLTAPGGAFLADHAVNLDKECWQYQAMVDLYGYLRRHADPDRRTEAEAAMLAGLGAWLGTEVLGPVADQLVKQAPVTVRVRIP